MRPMLRERQNACEAAGQVSEDTNAQFIAAGFYRILQPRCFGGYEFDLPTFLKVMIAISRGCSDSGWVLALTAGHAFLMASFPEEGQREAFGDKGEFRAPSVAIARRDRRSGRRRLPRQGRMGLHVGLPSGHAFYRRLHHQNRRRSPGPRLRSFSSTAISIESRTIGT